MIVQLHSRPRKKSTASVLAIKLTAASDYHLHTTRDDIPSSWIHSCKEFLSDTSNRLVFDPSTTYNICTRFPSAKVS